MFISSKAGYWRTRVMGPRRIRTALWVIAGVLPPSLVIAGCSEHKVRAAAPVAAAPSAPVTVHPMSVAPDTTATPPQEASVPPPAPPAAAATASTVTIPTSKPPAPKRQAEQPAATEADATPHPAAPQISPELSAEDQSTYQRKTTDDIATAEANLQRMAGKQLNAAQQDLVEKIHSFVAQSRDAGKAGDWVRAQNLSQKARLLSAELIESL